MRPASGQLNREEVSDTSVLVYNCMYKGKRSEEMKVTHQTLWALLYHFSGDAALSLNSFPSASLPRPRALPTLDYVSHY